MTHDETYWTQRYHNNQTQWDTGAVTTPLKEYFDQLTDQTQRILIPGCGNAYEAAYLYQSGFKNVVIIDIAQQPLELFGANHPEFPKNRLICRDFFELEDSFDLVIEQTFFCALHPSQRQAYAVKMHELLKPNGRLVGLLFEDELYTDHPPYGGSADEYQAYFLDHFEFHVFERCYNSIKPRQGRELFINLLKK
ncbi:methyltransferase domain-containing protein [Fulvivirga sp. M361]|uniref:methyltransferase domain-containing protein n=1 Tax=Fulvivirga sp. M361 TaxID=2594266 RepID=UPI00117AA442|nr:methyltransferase domain-containing protein [Fulvivirga sp. M361]TRX61721.1 methyltransferase domain-containing protein [Fulvivirga sp. M361]